MFGVARDVESTPCGRAARAGPIDIVGRGDEDDLREIERHIEVAIDKSVVLPRVEHFEQRAGGVAAKIRAELVDFIEHDDRIARADPAQFLNDAARHRADVSPPMAANFRFVANSAEAHARTNFRPSASAMDWPRLVLPTPGGPRKQRIGPRPFGLSLRTARYSISRRFTFSRS